MDTKQVNKVSDGLVKRGRLKRKLCIIHMITESKILDRKLLKSGHKIDQSLLWMIVLMSSFSLMMIYSASIAYAAHDGGDQWFYLGRHFGTGSPQ